MKRITNNRADVYQKITDQMIAMIEAGTRPWSKSWNGSTAPNIPLRLTGVPYRGINVLTLWVASMTKGKAIPATPAMLDRVVNHVAALAERREIAQAVVGRIVIECAQAIYTRVIRTIAARSAPAMRTRRPLPSRQCRRSASHQRPSPRWKMRAPWGRRQCSHRPLARPKRINFDSSGQSIGYSQRCSAMIGMTIL